MLNNKNFDRCSVSIKTQIFPLWRRESVRTTLLGKKSCEWYLTWDAFISFMVTDPDFSWKGDILKNEKFCWMQIANLIQQGLLSHLKCYFPRNWKVRSLGIVSKCFISLKLSESMFYTKFVLSLCKIFMFLRDVKLPSLLFVVNVKMWMAVIWTRMVLEVPHCQD